MRQRSVSRLNLPAHSYSVGISSPYLIKAPVIKSWLGRGFTPRRTRRIIFNGDDLPHLHRRRSPASSRISIVDDLLPTNFFVDRPVLAPGGQTVTRFRRPFVLLDEHTYSTQFFEIRSEPTGLSTTRASDGNAKNTTRLGAVQLRTHSPSGSPAASPWAGRIQRVYTRTPFRSIRTRDEDSTPAVRRTDGI
jgi:hypothetical protein